MEDHTTPLFQHPPRPFWQAMIVRSTRAFSKFSSVAAVHCLRKSKQLRVELDSGPSEIMTAKGADCDSQLHNAPSSSSVSEQNFVITWLLGGL